MSSLLLNPNPIQIRRAYGNQPRYQCGGHVHPATSSTKGPFVSTSSSLQNALGQDAFALASRFPEQGLDCASQEVFNQIINEEQCSDIAGIHGKDFFCVYSPTNILIEPFLLDDLLSPLPNDGQSADHSMYPDTPLSPTLKNFLSPLSPYSELSPYPSPHSDASYLSEASNSPYSPAYPDFPYSPLSTNSLDSDNWIAGGAIDNFSSLGLDDDGISAFGGFHLFGTEHSVECRSPDTRGELKYLSPLIGGLNAFDASPAAPEPLSINDHHFAHWVPTSPSPNISIKVELSPPPPVVPALPAQQVNLLAPSSLSVAAKNRRKKERASKRHSPVSTTRSVTFERRPQGNTTPTDASIYAQTEATIAQLIAETNLSESPAMDILKGECCTEGIAPKEAHNRTLVYLRDFWGRRREHCLEIHRLIKTIPDDAWSTGLTNSVASVAILKASNQRRKRPGNFWCPRCLADFTSCDRAASHLWAHLAIEPYICPHRGCGQHSRTPDVAKRHAGNCPANPNHPSKQERTSYF